jgi:alpha-tubulin suppressor-like RCC1 family protein
MAVVIALAACDLKPGSDLPNRDGSLDSSSGETSDEPDADAAISPDAAVDAADADSTRDDVAEASESRDANEADVADDGCAASCETGRCFEGVCGGDEIVQVSAGLRFGCALRRSGSVWCWGFNPFGETGLQAVGLTCTALDQSIGQCQPAPHEVAGVTDAQFVSAGAQSACAVTRDFAVWCWGANDSEQLGHDNDVDPLCGTPDVLVPCSPAPQVVHGLFALSVSVGQTGACAATTLGSIACWGANDDGQFGVGSLDPPMSFVPALWVPDRGIGQVVYSSRSPHVCARLSDGSIRCWGGVTDKLGLGHAPGSNGDAPCSSGNHCTPVPHDVVQADDVEPAFDADAPASDLSVGDDDACAVQNGSVLCWGENATGAAGVTSGSHFAPIEVPLPGASAQAAQVAVGPTHACAVLTDGSLWCWGENGFGELGIGVVDSSAASDAGVAVCPSGVGCRMPVRVALPASAGGRARQVSVNDGWTLVLMVDGTVWSWGVDETAQLGHLGLSRNEDQRCPVPQSPRTVACSPTPTRIDGLP